MDVKATGRWYIENLCKAYNINDRQLLNMFTSKLAQDKKDQLYKLRFQWERLQEEKDKKLLAEKERLMAEEAERLLKFENLKPLFQNNIFKGALSLEKNKSMQDPARKMTMMASSIIGALKFHQRVRSSSVTFAGSTD